MSESRHERPGVYSSYDASTVITTGRGSKTVGVAAKAVKGTVGTVVTLTNYAAGVEAFDTPFTDVNDDGGLWEDARYAKSLGFTGKASISPRHVPGINAVFSPTQAEIAYAQEVLAAIDEAKRQGRGAISLHGKMIDAPIVTRARQTLASAQILGLIGGETHGN